MLWTRDEDVLLNLMLRLHNSYRFTTSSCDLDKHTLRLARNSCTLLPTLRIGSWEPILFPDDAVKGNYFPDEVLVNCHVIRVLSGAKWYYTQMAEAKYSFVFIQNNLLAYGACVLELFLFFFFIMRDRSAIRLAWCIRFTIKLATCVRSAVIRLAKHCRSAIWMKAKRALP